MNEERYGELLNQARPRIIQTPEEHERMLTLAEGLMEKGEQLSPEEEQLLALIVLLIEAFETHVADEDAEEEEETDRLPAAHETLRRLMQGQGLELHDISDIFGNPHAAGEALEGKRQISRGQAKALGKLFRVPPKLFHSGL
jgi:HTH-type transcriptional regulator/antitoxin HigA